MAKDKPTDIVAKMVEMLTPLAPEERMRVVRASLVLLGENPTDSAGYAGNDSPGEGLGLGARAKAWIKQNSLSMEELEHVFQIADGEVSVIGEVPGKTNKERTRNAYVLTGITKLLLNEVPHFEDKSARALCQSSGCYDSTNHAWYLKERGNEFIGDKDKGWTLTAPGLKHGALLVKEMRGTK